MPDLRYRKVDPRMWGDDKVRRLSPLAPSGQALWLFLLTTNLADVMPGVIPHGRAAIAEALGWSLEDFDRCWAEIEAAGMARADWSARLVWLPKALAYNRPVSPNVVRSWARAWSEVPECPLKDALRLSLGRALRTRGPGFHAAWLQVLAGGRRATAPEHEDDTDATPHDEEIPSEDAQVSEGFGESRARARARTRSLVAERSDVTREARARPTTKEALFTKLFVECPRWLPLRRLQTTKAATSLEADALVVCERLLALPDSDGWAEEAMRAASDLLDQYEPVRARRT